MAFSFIGCGVLLFVSYYVVSITVIAIVLLIIENNRGTKTWWIKANAVTFLEMTSETTMANAKFLITKKSMLYFWDRSFFSKHCHAGSLGKQTG